MALIFGRIARNYIKNGYFPTDEESLEGILRVISVAPPDDERERHVRVFDPTVGEGTALAEIAHYLREKSEQEVVSHGIELDQGRALCARTILDGVIMADLHACKLAANAYSFMLCNPPYGLSVADKAMTADGEKGKRIDHILTHLAVPALAPHGVIALILPVGSFDRGFTGYLISRFKGIKVFKAGVNTYKQIVLLGVKRKSATTAPTKSVDALRKEITNKKLKPISEVDVGEVNYAIPQLLTPSDKTLGIGGFIRMLNLEPNQLAEAIVRSKLGGTDLINSHFGFTQKEKNSAPLMQLGSWHSGLALAAGLLVGVVTSDNGTKTLIVKGRTTKVKHDVVTEKQNSQGQTTSVETVSLDRFKMVIRGINLTPGEHYGTLIEIA